MAEPNRRSQERFTYGDYLSWPDEERWELIEGTAYAMTPAPSRRHQELLTELISQIHTFLKGHQCRVYPAPFDVRLPVSSEADQEVDTVVQPDISVICDRMKLDEKGCRGAPDLIMEIVSPSTASHDQIRKVSLYEKHGVREYWILHPVDRVVTIRLLGGDGRYAAPRIIEGTGAVEVNVLPGLSLDLDGAFAATE